MVTAFKRLLSTQKRVVPSFFLTKTTGDDQENYFREKVQGEKVKVAKKNRDDRVHHLTEFGLRIQGKKIVPAQEKKILKIK
jgi:hypothetical protein